MSAMVNSRPSTLRPKSLVYEHLKDLIHYSEVKRLVSSIRALQQQKQFHSLAVLSLFPSEGKTLFCAVIAMAYVESSRSSVLVVDATTLQHPDSLVLRDCVDPSIPQIDFISLAERRNQSNGHHTPPPDPRQARDHPSVNSGLVKIGQDTGGSLALVKESDQALITKVAGEGAKQYELVLLDTVPLTARNKSNIDPIMAARLSDASVLMVSPALLNAPDLRACMKLIEDPALHLIGMIANSEFVQ